MASPSPMMSAPAATCALAKAIATSVHISSRSRTHAGRSYRSVSRCAHPAQIGGLGQRTLHPAHDRDLPPACSRKRRTASSRSLIRRPVPGSEPQPAQIVRLGQQRDLAQRQAIIRKLDLRRRNRRPRDRDRRWPGGYPGRTPPAQRSWPRTARDSPGSRRENGCPMIVRGELHHDVEVGRPVDRLAAEACHHTFVAVHSFSLRLIGYRGCLARHQETFHALHDAGSHAIGMLGQKCRDRRSGSRSR